MPTPTQKTDTQQALHWARLVAKNNPNTITILITTDPNWYHNLHPHEGPFPDSHVITHFKADTITYDEPTIPPELRIEPRTENCDIRILCIHHKTTPINPIGYIGHIHNIGTSLHIPSIFTTTAPPTPTNTPVNHSKKWSQLTYPPPSPPTQLTNIPPITNHDICLPPKYPPQFCYYTDGSFIPPKALTDEHWRREKARYGIYNAFKNLKIAERLPGLQNILRAKIMAIYHTLCLLTTTYRNEPAHIFTDCLNVLYLLNTQIKHPTLYNSHPDKKILEDIIKMLQSQIQTVGTHEHQIIRIGVLKCLIRFRPGDLSIVQGFCEVEEVTNSPYPLIFHSLVEFPETLVFGFPISRAISSFRNLPFRIVVLRATCNA